MLAIAGGIVLGVLALRVISEPGFFEALGWLLATLFFMAVALAVVLFIVLCAVH